ncbi:hypothetical protein [Dolichospermum compactum]|uniref:Lipoprotein n=1 Tax=Dolichospermum compactum NIES-806 TaxID=1973481 RepID=A0A1Z4VAD3_9CYAN|nr:hypothetical protein [Dolichospermum compactum]BAZ88447.1 hypothetical protein NIES806_46850 [Dolichospermum compactum NIES-806]
MKKLIPTISIILSCISLISCGITPQDRVPEDSSDTVTQSRRESSSVAVEEKEDNQESSPVSETQEDETNQEDEKKLVRKNLDNNKNTNKDASKQPKVGTVTKLVNGDLMCYVTLVDKKGIEHNVGATFEICAEEEKVLNKKINAVYEIQSLSDCQSAEPCGKTRKESIITKMEIVNEGAEEKSPSGDSKNGKSQTLSNGKWTITLSNTDSWNGVNGTGDVSYQGCDTNGKCLQLTGGKVSCRDGKCVTAWQNGDYVYILEQPITEDGNSTSTLIVRKDNTEILNSPGLKVVSSN